MWVMHTTGETWRLGHRPALDGLRGIAVLLVVVGHSVPGMAAAGSVGVTVFFALSGFLITALLLEEHTRTGRVSLRGFYVRRARRLLPALLVLLAVALVFEAGMGIMFTNGGEVTSILLYYGNWRSAFGAPPMALVHTWSLAVEEQFYLVWPLLLIGLLRWAPRRAALALTAAGVVSSMLARVLLWNDGAGSLRVYFGTDTNAAPLLIGCLLALWLHGRPMGASRPQLAAFTLVAVGALCATGAGLGERMVAPIGAALLTGVALLALTRGADVGGWLAHRWLVLVGRRSYALYLWHFPLFAVAAPMCPGPTLPWLPVMAVVSWGLAALSWRYVEQPFLRRKAIGTVRPAGSIPAPTVLAATPVALTR